MQGTEKVFAQPSELIVSPRSFVGLDAGIEIYLSVASILIN